MCGRYVINEDRDAIAEAFNAEVSDPALWAWDPRYNIAPTSVVPVVAFDGRKQRKLVPMRWGLHPHWSRESPETTQYGPLFNARVETAASKPSFRTPWKRRRALIPATHWYEWTGGQGGKIPWCIKPEAGGLFAFAGLWDHWRAGEGITLLSCAILTTDAAGPVSQLHHREPVRLPEADWQAWLDPDSRPADVLNAPRPTDDLIFWEVGRAVNSSRASGAELIAPSI